MDKLNLTKIKNYSSATDPIKKVRRQVTDQEEISAKRVSNKGVLSRIYKKLSKLNRNKSNPSEGRQKTWTDASPQRTYRWQVRTREDG